MGIWGTGTSHTRGSRGVRFLSAHNLEYLTPRQVAERLGVNTITVRRWIAAGQLKAVRMGGKRSRLFIPSDAIEAKMAQE